MNQWQMYWLTRLDSISVCFCIAIVILIITLIIFTIDACANERGVTSNIKTTLWILVSVLLVGSLVPNTNEMAAIIVVPKIINAVDKRDIPSKVLDLANKWLENKLKSDK